MIFLHLRNDVVGASVFATGHTLDHKTALPLTHEGDMTLVSFYSRGRAVMLCLIGFIGHFHERMTSICALLLLARGVSSTHFRPRHPLAVSSTPIPLPTLTSFVFPKLIFPIPVVTIIFVRTLGLYSLPLGRRLWLRTRLWHIQR
jgi:hypothetical protein